MKLEVRKPDQPKRMVDGAEARAELREVLKSIGESILLPMAPYTGVIRRRACEALRRGQPVWSEPNDDGQPSRHSTILRMPPKIIGVIRADGTWDGEGPDPRTQDEVLGADGEGGDPSPQMAPKP